MKKSICILTSCLLCALLFAGALCLVACNKKDTPPEPIVEPEIEVSGAYTLADGTFVADEDNAFGYIPNRDVSEGSVFVGGKDVREYDIEALRDAVAMVLQKNELFSGTIKENLRWGNPDATDEELRAIKITVTTDAQTKEQKA